ncbi:hypothetical protein [Nocardia aurea]|uniref:hypothetical protein n=1 Tax=Nocardia aurea TaxID=2144174 RepID=UPI0033AC50AD
MPDKTTTLPTLADQIRAQAAVSTRPGQLAELERIAGEVEARLAKLQEQRDTFIRIGERDSELIGRIVTAMGGDPEDVGEWPAVVERAVAALTARSVPQQAADLIAASPDYYTAARDSDGNIRMDHMVIAYSTNTRAEIEDWIRESVYPRSCATYLAALAVLDHEESAGGEQ